MTSDSLPAHPLRWWDLACVGVLVFIGLICVVDALAGEPGWAAGAPPAWRTMLLLAPIVIFAISYVALGRAAVLHGALNLPLSSRTVIFLSLLLVVLAIGTLSAPMYAMLQTLAYPMVWTIMKDYRGAILWSVAIAVAVGAGLYVGLVNEDPVVALLTSLITAFVSLVFAIAMGTWITRIHDRGEGYRLIAEQLRRSQEEVAALSAEAGAAAERERMSRDLHDTLTQTLTGLVMLSEQTERAIDAGDTARARDRLARVAAAARSAVAEARALVATTQSVGDDGLVASIERIAAALRTDTGLECSVEVIEDPASAPFSREREVVLLRAAQEGIANARKHSGASRVSITLTRRTHGSASLRIDDNGVGPGSSGAGFGLTGLTDRVRSAGGDVRFGPRPGGGARLEIDLMPENDASSGSGA